VTYIVLYVVGHKHQRINCERFKCVVMKSLRFYFFKIFSLYVKTKHVPHARVNYICRLLVVHDVTQVNLLWKIH
jgi:hypothetical protein